MRDKMFSAKTIHSGKIKALFEVIFNNTSTVCFTISEHGLFSEITTTSNALICVELPSSCFEDYTFTFPEPQHIGLGSHVNSFFKSLKTKTTVVLSMTKPYTLDIVSEDAGCTSSYSAAVISAQNISPSASYCYEKPGFDVSCSNFNSMCKSFAKTSTLDVSKHEGTLSFSFELSGIASKKLTFGQKDSADSSLYYQQFKSDGFLRIGKLSSFADKIKLFAEVDLPFLINASSHLGTVKIYMRSSPSDQLCY